jgi:hypothetical protein
MADKLHVPVPSHPQTRCVPANNSQSLPKNDWKTGRELIGLVHTPTFATPRLNVEINI